MDYNIFSEKLKKIFPNLTYLCYFYAVNLIRNRKQIITMPEICRFYGIVIAMFGDDHNPPHFHVRYGSYKASITIDKGIVTGQLPRNVLNKVFLWLDAHYDELMDNWNRLKEGDVPLQIEPLK